MTQLDTPNIHIADALREGHVALSEGDAIRARRFFRQVTEAEPDNAAAWHGMADAVRPYKDKQQFLQRVLELQPDNAVAREQLAHVAQQIAAGEIMAPLLPRPAAAPEPKTLIEQAADAEAQAAAEAHAAATAATATSTPPPSTKRKATSTSLGFCYNHSDRETGLRCVQCSRFICTDCVRPAFVGQLCPDCAKGRRPVNYQVTTANIITTTAYMLFAGLVLTPLSIFLLSFIGFFAILIAFFAAPATAEGLIRLLDLITRNKRGREMQMTAAFSYAAGTLPWVVLPILGGGISFTLLIGLAFSFIVISTLVARLR